MFPTGYKVLGNMVTLYCNQYLPFSLLLCPNFPPVPASPFPAWAHAHNSACLTLCLGGKLDFFKFCSCHRKCKTQSLHRLLNCRISPATKLSCSCLFHSPRSDRERKEDCFRGILVPSGCWGTGGVLYRMERKVWLGEISSVIPGTIDICLIHMYLNASCCSLRLPS